MEDIAAEIRREREEPGPGILAVERKIAGDVIGYCGLVFHGNGAPDEPELAYELLRRAHGFGYATEAGGAVVAWAAEAGYERLWATVRAWNVASRRVLEKLGFRETGQVDADAAHGDSLLTVRSSADCHLAVPRIGAHLLDQPLEFGRRRGRGAAES